MIKYAKSTGRIIEKYLTKEEAQDMKYMRDNAIYDVYSKLSRKSKNIKARFDELFNNNDYLMTITKDQL